MTLTTTPVLNCDGIDPQTQDQCKTVFTGQGGDSATGVRADAAESDGWVRAKVGNKPVDYCGACASNENRQRRSIIKYPAPVAPNPFTVSMQQMVQGTGFSELALAHFVVDNVVRVWMPDQLGLILTVDAARFLPRDLDKLRANRTRLDYMEYAKRYPVRSSNTDRPTALGIVLRKLGR